MAAGTLLQFLGRFFQGVVIAGVQDSEGNIGAFNPGGSTSIADIVDGQVNQDITGSSQNYALSGISVVAGDNIRVASEENIWIAFGTTGVAAQETAAGTENDSFLMFAGTENFTIPASATHIAWIGDTATSGTLCIAKV